MLTLAVSAVGVHPDALSQIASQRRMLDPDEQVHGNTAIPYTSYEMDLMSGGQSQSERGMATEVFVMKDGQWLNTGW